MRNIKLTLEYDGTDFHGFQRQRRLRTVQGELEARFSRLLHEKVNIVGAGRTDAGVHASGQVANFHTGRPVALDAMADALNGVLPRDVKVQRCAEVSGDFHARRAARARTYRYTVVEREVPSPIIGRFALVAPPGLDDRAISAAARSLVGRHDFRAFQAGGSETQTTERTIRQLACRREGAALHITVEADSFLYRMVRLIVGALLAVGRGKVSPEHLREALRAGRRLDGCPPAAPCGLCLVRISYGDAARPTAGGDVD